MEKPIIVLDANAFISAQGLLSLAASHLLVTTPDVLNELRDAKTRDMLEAFPFPIQEMECDKKSLAIVKEFARKTGDLASLSDVDMELIALTYMLYVQNGKQGDLRKEPPAIKESSVNDLQQSDSESSSESEANEAEQLAETKEVEEQEIKEKGEPETHQLAPESLKQDTAAKDKQDESHDNQNDDDQWIVIPQKQKKRVEESDDEVDDEEGWVTPQNYEQKMAEGDSKLVEENTQEEDAANSIWLMTADFAMQNVAIQMGILLKSLDGRKINQIRRFILECYLCWKQYKVESNKVKLCKECGYNSLSKIAYSMTKDGELVLHRKQGWQPNKKVLEWKQRKYEEQQKKKKHQHARRKKQASIFQS